MTTAHNALERGVTRIEDAKVLDRPASLVQKVAGKLIGSGPVGDVLGGKPIGHPLHPALVAVPIGSWAAATVLDLTGADAKAAQRLVGYGVLAAVPTALSGAHDFLDTDGAERRVALVHALTTDVAGSLYLASWLARRRGNRARGVALALAGGAVLAGAGWLGGHLVFSRGVGVE